MMNPVEFDLSQEFSLSISQFDIWRSHDEPQRDIADEAANRQNVTD
jgi:hypothetical protein